MCALEALEEGVGKVHIINGTIKRALILGASYRFRNRNGDNPLRSGEMEDPQAKYLMETYSRLPITMKKGSGSWLWDTEGKKIS